MNAPRNPSKIALVTSADDAVLGVAGAPPALIQLSQIDAVCLSVTLHDYKPYRQQKWVLTFSPVAPEGYSDHRLELFLRTDPKWRTPPLASKLYKAACVAYGSQLPKGFRITQGMFVNRVFRCQLRQVHRGAAAYTIVDSLLEKLTR
jgi:hypothetical protein